MKEIIKGVTNHHLRGQTEESKKKMDICIKCDKSYKDDIFGLRCKECGCVLKYKTKSDSPCPLGKF